MTEIQVLVVDDDPAVRSQLSSLLALRGCLVKTASNGAEALQLLESFDPSLVLLDMLTPVLDGWGFVRTLEARHLTVPIIVMGLSSEAEGWARDIGAAGFLPKPIRASRLLACVQIPDQRDSGTVA